MIRAWIVMLSAVALAACQPEVELTPTEKAAKDRSECMVVATDQSGFDPIIAEAPVRTVSESHARGGDLKEGAADGRVRLAVPILSLESARSCSSISCNARINS